MAMTLTRLHDDIDEDTRLHVKKKNEVAQTRDARASQIERKRLLFVSARGRNEGKEKEICDLRTGQIVSAAGHKLSY